MTLATHALVGAAAAQLFPAHPYAAFAAGFASHFVADAIPHWDYGDYLHSFKRDHARPLETDMVINRRFVLDFGITACDALVGIVASVLLFSYSLFHTPQPIVLIGAVAGVLPDALQFVYYKTRTKALEPLQRFHIWLQHGVSPLPISPWLGLGYQAALVVVIAGIEKIFI